MTQRLDPDQPTNSYNVEEFRIRGSDTQGNFDRIFCRVAPGELLQMTRIVQSKLFPYTGLGDLFRHAVYRHVRYLGDLEPLPSVTQQVDAMMELLRVEEFHQNFMNMFTRTEAVIGKYTLAGANGEARRVLAGLVNHIDGMPAGYWQDRYRKELEEKFGHLMDGGETRSLLEGEDDDGGGS